MAAGKHREAFSFHDVEQRETKKMVPFITRVTTFGQPVRKLVLPGQPVRKLVSTYLIWIFVKQSNATLWVLDTCLIVGLLPLMIILLAAALSSKMYNFDSPKKKNLLL